MDRKFEPIVMGMGWTKMMLLSLFMSIPLYKLLREMRDSLREIADKIGS